MKNIEYGKMAYLYDKFYKNKNYKKEVDFITTILGNKKLKILDAGCGTGNHAKILNDNNFEVYGFDQSKDMVNIANSKIKDHFFVENLLTIKSNDKFDAIISFFAVFNHLKNYKEFKLALSNLKNLLNPNGSIIIDLHNPLKNGRKTETIDNITRIMKWKKCSFLKKEFSKIEYIIDGKKYKTNHIFKIFSIKKLQKIAMELGFLSIEFYENYNISSPATNKSKNIQIVLRG